LEDVLVRVGDPEVPDPSEVAHKRRSIVNWRVFVQVMAAPGGDGGVWGAIVGDRFPPKQGGAVNDHASLSLSDLPAERAEVETRDETPYEARKDDVIAQFFFLGELLEHLSRDGDQGRVIVVDVARGRGGKGAFEDTSEGGSLGDQAEGPVHVDEWVAGARRAFPYYVQCFEDFWPVTEAVGVFAPESPYEIPMEEIEAEEGAGHEEVAVGANRPPARGGSGGPELMDRCR